MAQTVLSSIRSSLGSSIVTVLLAVVLVVYITLTPGSLSALGAQEVFNDAVVLAIGAAALTLTVLIGELDLSGISVITIANSIIAVESASGTGIVGAVSLAFCAGLLVGVINGFLISVIELPSLAVTIGTLIVGEGVALLILPAAGGSVAPGIVNSLTGTIGAVPDASIAIACLVALWLYFRTTPLCAAIYAVGTNKESARLSGIPVKRTVFYAFVISGVLYAVAGCFFSAVISSGQPTVSNELLLSMYAAVAIGGTALSGGRGGVVGSILGAGFLIIMEKALLSAGVASYFSQIFSGVIMVLAIGAGTLPALKGRTGGNRRPAY